MSDKIIKGLRELNERRNQLHSEIEQSIHNFEKDTGVNVTAVTVQINKVDITSWGERHTDTTFGEIDIFSDVAWWAI